MDRQFDLKELKIAKPCHARWDEMSGDEQRRFCGSCKKNVYNVAGMTEREVRELVSRSEVLPCLRLSRRADGTVITRDCPVGVAAMYRRVGLAVLGGMAFLATIAMASIGKERERYDGETLADVLRSKPVVGPVIEKVWPSPTVIVGALPEQISPVMGEIAAP